MSEEVLTDEEAIAVKWQYGMFGSFFNTFMSAVTQADGNNRKKLACAFPDHVSAVERYQNEAGWWKTVREKAIRVGYIQDELAVK